ncbi:MAG: phytanoyl-CoA dioxygenase family protein [Hyphomicrobiaceae bacterium]
MLNKDQIAAYQQNGYVVPDFRLSDEELNDIKGAHDRLLAKHPEFRDYCPNLRAYDTGFLAVARKPEILDMVEQVIGPDFALWNSSFFAKPAHNGKPTPWHQDGEYWPIRPLATCTVWIAVDAATPDNGCLRVIRGSHTDGSLKRHRTVDADDVTLHQELMPDEYNEDEAVDLVLEPGQISLHDVFILHGSEANTSNHSRRGMTLRFMPTTSVFDREKAHQMFETLGITDHSHRTLYLMRGRDQSGENDFRIRL